MILVMKNFKNTKTSDIIATAVTVITLLSAILSGRDSHLYIHGSLQIEYNDNC